MVIKTEYKFSELTGKIIGCAMRVHSKLGNGYQEVIYQRALRIEMMEANMKFERELEMPIFYNDIDSRRADFLVKNKVKVELEAVTKLENVHLAQSLNYLEALSWKLVCY